MRQGHLHHRLPVVDVRLEDARRVDDEDARGHAAGLVPGLDDAHRRAHLARHAGLVSRLGRLGLPPLRSRASQRVEERALPDVGHADDEGAQARERVGGLRGLLEPSDEGVRGGLLVLVPEDGPVAVYPLQGILGAPAVASEVGLGVDDEALTAGEGALEVRVMRGEGKSEVAAFEDEGDGWEDRLYLVRAGLVVTKKIGLGDRVGDSEGVARDEACHCSGHGIRVEEVRKKITALIDIWSLYWFGTMHSSFPYS